MVLNILNKNKNITNKKLLLFIGSPRTGSTMLGQIINYHPNCLVANEFRLLNKIVLERKSAKKNLLKLEKYAHKQFINGLENDKKYGKTLSQYQKKWKGFKSFANKPEFKKKEILLIGEKKAGGNIQLINDLPLKAKEFFNNIENLYFIQIVRNPIDAALSLMKSHNVKKFEDAIYSIIKKTIDAEKFAKNSNYNYHFLYYESLYKNTEEEIRKIFNFLDINCSLEWINEISKTVSKPEDKNISKSQKNIFIETLAKFENSNILNCYI